MQDKLLKRYIDFASLPSTSGNEQEVRKLIAQLITSFGLKATIDTHGNISASLSGTGKPVLLNAHMDRVKPGLGFTPIIKDNLVYSDGQTNSGADDILGIIAILEILEALTNQKNHRPIEAIFTIEEEIGGIHGAKVVDITKLKTDEGIIIDNAFDEAGVIVSKGSNLVWAITTITGKSGHSGKDLSKTINALTPVLFSGIQPGIYDNDQTRLNIGSITINPGVGNATPGEVSMLTEFRSFLPEDALTIFIQDTFAVMNKKAKEIGATIDTKLDVHCKSYIVDFEEPLVKEYAAILKTQGQALQSKPTFVGSDGNSFRARGLKTFVISTGARNEHTTAEYFDINGITQLTNNLMLMLS